MSDVKQDIIWKIKVDKNLDAAVQKTIALLGYNSRAELTREAVREFLIRRKLFSLLGSEPSQPPSKSDISPAEALQELSKILKKIPKEIIEEETKAARNETYSPCYERIL